MKQRTEHVERRVLTDAKQTGRNLTARNIIHGASALLCIAGLITAVVFIDPSAGQDLPKSLMGLGLVVLGVVGMAATGKPEEPSGPKRNSHKDATRAASTKMIDGGVITSRTTVSNPNNYNGDRQKIADNHTLLRTQRKAIMSNIPH
jgi:hypothetical protein